MSWIKKPVARHPNLPKNKLGLTYRDYEGSLSTLCAGCGHDSVTAAIVQAFWGESIEPHKAVKLSGIGCSSKTPTYFLSDAHGFNSLHGRMPSVATGANAARGDLTYIGISGDGDSLSIGLGQFCHAIRRNVNLTYVLENNGVYGLTKGQFSASADLGSKSKKGDINQAPPIDPVMIALTLGATFVARSFSGDKEQLVPIMQAALRHKGFAIIDVISPCVTFNDHKGSKKSFMYTRQHYHEVTESNLVDIESPIETRQNEGDATCVRLFDGSTVVLRSTSKDYDPTNRNAAYAYLSEVRDRGEVVTGLLYIEDNHNDMHSQNRTATGNLVHTPFDELCPGKAELDVLMEEFR
jgi:2-oxoglutarate ferredoxin oxidoreductase subunit beta